MYFFLCAISGIITMLLRGSFYDHVMVRSSKIKRFYFWFFSMVVALITFIPSIIISGQYSFRKMCFFIVLNTTLDFFLTLFYHTNHLYTKVLYALLFYSFSAVSEFVAGSLLYTLIPDFDNTSGLAQDSYVTTIGGLILCLIVVLCCSIPHTSVFSGANLRRSLLSVSTPALSVALLFLFSNFHELTFSGESKISLPAFFAGILILNIVNYVLLNDLSRLTRIEEQLRMQKKQLDFQAANYEKISHSYKEGRRIIHEMKRFNSYILTCAENQEYQKIIDYINTNSTEIEKRLLCVNTGNLVVDSLVSNYDAVARSLGLDFNVEIRFDAGDIPFSDYDMCIVLGNLLDNAFDEIRRHTDSDVAQNVRPHIDLKLVAKEHFFVLRIENTLNTDNRLPAKNSPDLVHGYGLINVKEIVSKYNGIYYQKTSDDIYSTTISIPILRDSVGAIIRQPAAFEKYEPAPPP